MFISCVVLNKTDRVHLYSISNVWNIFQIIKRLSCDCPNTLLDKCDFSFSSYRSFSGIDLQPSSWQNRMQKHFLQKRSLSEIRLLAHKSQVEWSGMSNYYFLENKVFAHWVIPTQNLFLRCRTNVQKKCLRKENFLSQSGNSLISSFLLLNTQTMAEIFNL